MNIPPPLLFFEEVKDLGLFCFECIGVEWLNVEEVDFQYCFKQRLVFFLLTWKNPIMGEFRNWIKPTEFPYYRTNLILSY